MSYRTKVLALIESESAKVVPLEDAAQLGIEADEKIAALRNALRQLFANVTVYPSALEAYMEFDLEQWAAMAYQLLEDHDV